MRSHPMIKIKLCVPRKLKTEKGRERGKTHGKLYLNPFRWFQFTLLLLLNRRVRMVVCPSTSHAHAKRIKIKTHILRSIKINAVNFLLIEMVAVAGCSCTKLCHQWKHRAFACDRATHPMSSSRNNHRCWLKLSRRARCTGRIACWKSQSLLWPLDANVALVPAAIWSNGRMDDVGRYRRRRHAGR